MAPKPQQKKNSGSASIKRKTNPTQKSDGQVSNFKKPKLSSNPKKTINSQNKVGSQPSKFPKKEYQKPHAEKGEVEDSKKQARLRSKELAQARKKIRKKHYTLEQELALLWEKMRRRNISKEDRSRLVGEAVKKMQGKISEIARSHIASRVLQTCVKHCTQDERNAVFTELQPHFISLASNTYAVRLVTKLLDLASKEQLAEFISSLHGHVASLLRQMVGSLVIEHAYCLGNASQKQTLLMELYSPELQLFKDLVTMKQNRLEDIISKLQLQKSSVARHMTSVLQPILEKGILAHSIVHRALLEYLDIADKFSAADVIQQLSGPSFVRIIATKDGSRLGMLCIRHGSAKDRKKIIKGMKGNVEKIASDKFGSMVLVCILSVVDDTKLVSKIIIRELEKNLKELILDQNTRRPFMQLLHPDCSRYFNQDDLVSLNLSIPSLKANCEPDDEEANEQDKDGDSDGDIQMNEGGKKDPFKRRQELLVDSGLAEKLIEICSEMAEVLLKSKYGRDVMYEVAIGGSDGILHPTLDEKLLELYEAIASIAAQPKVEAEEHILEQFHSSRTIRKLVIDCPSFATVLWEKALKGNCAVLAKGHSSKVISAFLETTDSAVKKLAVKELQPLIKSGDLSLPKPNESATDK
ncbi:pumilio homolog 24-like [Salvia splendens]|uniref:pumilio homolog 24-like n=1 Tax=Salvia splendens TaxID=180675 RepID=UPI001C279B3F|nr:pumilio homolog 24-like [Salvia splendens]